MYTRPIIYKIYSIFTFAVSGLFFLSSLISVFVSIPETADVNPAVFTALKVFTILIAAVSLFLEYINFTSMFTFARMIQYEESNQIGPFRKPAFAFPAKFYSKFGTIITLITFICSFLYAIGLIIFDSVIHQAFLAIPIIAIIMLAICNVLVYINYYARYKAFGDLLDLLSQSDPNTISINNIKDNKPGLLRAYCSFLYIFSMVCLFAILIFEVFNILRLAMQIGIVATLIIFVSILIIWAVFFINMAVTGCFFDNHAKMLEHYMIKYKLI